MIFAIPGLLCSSRATGPKIRVPNKVSSDHQSHADHCICVCVCAMVLMLSATYKTGLTGHTEGVKLIIDKHDGVVTKARERTVCCSDRDLRAHNHTFDDLTALQPRINLGYISRRRCLRTGRARTRGLSFLMLPMMRSPVKAWYGGQPTDQELQAEQ